MGDSRMVVQPSYRALRVVLLLLMLDAVAKAGLLLFGGRALLLRLFPSLQESEISPLLLLNRQEYGLATLVFALLLYWAVRDPVRNVAVLYAAIVGLCLAALHEVISIYTEGANRFSSRWSTWAHALVRVGAAALLFYLRPPKGQDQSPAS